MGMCGARLYQPWHNDTVVPTLAQRYRCIIPDLPFGAHTLALNPDADLTPPGIARLLADFLTALDLAAVTLLASDTGGRLHKLSSRNILSALGDLC